MSEEKFLKAELDKITDTVFAYKPPDKTATKLKTMKKAKSNGKKNSNRADKSAALP